MVTEPARWIDVGPDHDGYNRLIGVQTAYHVLVPTSIVAPLLAILNAPRLSPVAQAVIDAAICVYQDEGGLFNSDLTRAVHAYFAARESYLASLDSEAPTDD